VTRLHTADPGNRVPHLAFQPESMVDTPILSIEDIHSAYYLRFAVNDEPGVLAEITRELSLAGISIGSMIQQPPEQGEATLIFLTHVALEKNVNRAMVAIEAMSFMRSTITRLRVESF